MDSHSFNCFSAAFRFLCNAHSLLKIFCWRIFKAIAAEEHCLAGTNGFERSFGCFAFAWNPWNHSTQITQSDHMVISTLKTQTIRKRSWTHTHTREFSVSDGFRFIEFFYSFNLREPLQRRVISKTIEQSQNDDKKRWSLRIRCFPLIASLIE